MEETLGKRVAACRKKLGITQDRLAEQLGVTAQAVSKWENDLSCPDIATLPKLAEIFGISVDALLGIVPPEAEAETEAKEAEIVTEESGDTDHKANWEFHWESGRKGNLGLAIWIILTAGWMFVSAYFQIDADFWDLLWINGLIVFGLWGLFPKFSFFRLGCALFGVHFLLEELNAISGYLNRDLLLPAFLLLFGLSLLADALRKPKDARFRITRNGKSIARETFSHDVQADSFRYECTFSGKHQLVSLPQLRNGSASVSFGHLTVDLSGCEGFAEDALLNAECAFGDLVILIPKSCKADIRSDSAFGSVDILGTHDPDPTATIYVDADVSFGRIALKYI